MAKKETTKKKATKKTSTKKVTSKKVIEEVADSIIENTKIQEEIEIKPEVVEEIKNDVVEQDPPMEVENGDPAVLNKSNVIDITDKPFEEAKKVLENAEEMVVYKANKEVIDAVVEEKKKKVEPTIEEAAMKATFKNTNNHKSNRLLDKSFGYSWNGMEIDF